MSPEDLQDLVRDTLIDVKLTTIKLTLLWDKLNEFINQQQSTLGSPRTFSTIEKPGEQSKKLVKKSTKKKK